MMFNLSIREAVWPLYNASRSAELQGIVLQRARADFFPLILAVLNETNLLLYKEQLGDLELLQTLLILF